MSKSKKIIASVILLTLICLFSKKNAIAQGSKSVLYVPLIGLTSVPSPLALPNGEGNVTYNYAVKNFLSEVGLTDVQVVDDTCSPVSFSNGDDNGDAKLDFDETWRYTCTTNISTTTKSTATATGTANNITAMHKAYATVVVGSDNPAPIVSIINITKIAYPLSLPVGGGKITFTYKVNNPGAVPLGNVKVSDNKCQAMSGRLGDTNGNNLLDTNEVWIYTCTTTLTQTTTNKARVTASANGLSAVGEASVTVKVDTSSVQTPSFPDTGIIPNFNSLIWKIMSVILTALIIILTMTKHKGKKYRRKTKSVKSG